MREFHAKEAVSIPEVQTSPTDDWATQVLADHLDDPCYAEICAVMEDHEPDQQITLVADYLEEGLDEHGYNRE